ncbi:MAG: PSD1 and planctomycete cytochrome C domain-containing protein [Planctomycetaceae bacterium]
MRQISLRFASIAFGLWSVNSLFGTTPFAVAEATPPAAGEVAAREKRGMELFTKEVRSILVHRCLECHGGKSVKGDFDLSTREKLIDSGSIETPAEDGSVPAAGLSTGSYLVELIEHTSDPKMPFKKPKMPAAEIALVRKWIDLGAPYDKPLVDASSAPPAEMKVTDSDRQFWSFRPLARVTPPVVKDKSWPRTDIDRFVLAKQEEMGLHPNGVASRKTLIRRATFDLTGLPPTPDEVTAFVNDSDPNAYDKLIDRLLDSPHYGERWARHWMDVARFAESHGYEQDYDRPHAYPYRDFLIKSLNADMPYDQFVRWQLAGDELAPNDPLAMSATGFLGAGVFPTQLTEAEFESARYDELDDMVTTTGVAFLGLSVGCARCHDHKFDPIPTKDYYRLAATFSTTIRSEIELDLNPAESQANRDAYASRKEELASKLRQFEQEELPKKLDHFLKTNPASSEVATSDWTLLEGVPVSSAGTKFEKQADGSWLSTSAAAKQEVITFTGSASLKGVRTLRLETLTHDSLPRKGPGRANNGNFALGNIEVAVSPVNRNETLPPKAVKLIAARATHQQNDGSLSVAASIDADPVSGWAVDMGGIGKDQAAVFDLEQPVGDSEGTSYTIKLTLNHPNQQHTIGRLRLSVSTLEKPESVVGKVDPLAEVRQALATLQKDPENVGARTTALNWYKSQLPEWQALRTQLDQHVAKGDGAKLSKVMVSSEGFPHMSHHADGRGYPHFYPETHFLTRGDVHQKGDVAAPGFLQVLMPGEGPGSSVNEFTVPKPDDWKRTSFRRATLASWMTDAEKGAGALVARVAVNRLWQHHFGRGIVASVNDFGLSGERPTHPELLEWLAHDLVSHGWQLKRLHKQIMLSAAYQQDGEFDEDRATIDRENQFFWRRAPQRLEGEAIRDAMLAASGQLDTRMYGPGSLDQNMKRRSVYFFIKRSQLIPMMMLFDWPEHLVSIGARSTTIIAPQALMFMNSTLGRQAAEAQANLLTKLDDSAAITRAYQLSYSRDPSPVELATSQKFLEQQTATYSGSSNPRASHLARVDYLQMLFAMNEFCYIE